MHPLLNDADDIRIVQLTGRVTSKLLDPIDSLLLVVPEGAKANVWNSLPCKRPPGGAQPAQPPH